MAINDYQYNPTGGSFSGRLPLKSISSLTFLKSVEGLYRHTGKRALGVYYPVRSLPSQYIDKDAEWPMVMAAGSIVSVVNIKDASAYKTADDESGIGVNGEVYVSIGVDGTPLKKSCNFLYDKDVSGLFTLCNGGVATTDKYKNEDGDYGIIDQKTGAAASAAADGYTRAANVPFGIVDFEISADMRYRYLNYDARNSTAGIRICLDGILTLPYIAFLGTKGAAKTAAIKKTLEAVNPRHQFVWFDVVDEAELDTVIRTGSLKSDAYGKFTVFDETNDGFRQRFATIKETRNRVPYDLDELYDSFPGSGMTGMDTGGLTPRLYDFTTKLVAVLNGLAPAAAKDKIKGAFVTPLKPTAVGYTDAAATGILFGQADVAFGLTK